MYIWIDSKEKIREVKKPPIGDNCGELVNEKKAYRYLKKYLSKETNRWHWKWI